MSRRGRTRLLRHRWPRSARRAMTMQKALRRRLRIGGRLRPKPRLVAGADVAYDPARGEMFAAVLVFSFPDLRLAETSAVRGPIRFPYVPGLLSFREAPALVSAFGRLSARPGLLICDGQGIAHPRGIGLASHLGLLLGIPTIGCAKSLLVGDHGAVGPRPGDRAPLRYGGRVVGAALRTRAGVKPVFVSPGHRIGLAEAARYVLACCRGFRLPEPVRQADLVAAALKRAPDAPAPEPAPRAGARRAGPRPPGAL